MFGLTRSAVYGDAARMPPSSVLSTRYKTARRRYPVIGRGPTTFSHDFVLLHGRCGASGSAGATVKWCQFNDDRRVRRGYYAAHSEPREVIRVRRCGTSGIVSIESRAKTASLATASSRMTNDTSRAKIVVVLYTGRANETGGARVTTFTRQTANSSPWFSLTSGSISNYPEHRSFSISTVERKQQVRV